MNQDYIRKFKNALSGRLLILKKKAQAVLTKFGPTMRAWMLRMKEQAGPEFRKRWNALKAYVRNLSWSSFLASLKTGVSRIDWKTAKVNALPLCAIAIMLVLMSGSMQSLAWYIDMDQDRNTFVVGDMDLKVYYKNDTMDDYEELTSTTNVFRDGALYEPGYTQVVYFKIVNEGDVAFDYKVSVTEVAEAAVDSTSVLGTPIHLADHLRFGLMTDSAEPALTRELARALDDGHVEKDLHIGEYSEFGDRTLESGDEDYAALVVYMPEEVGNEANYKKGLLAPRTFLGITVYAQQADTMEKS